MLTCLWACLGTAVIVGFVSYELGKIEGVRVGAHLRDKYRGED